MDTLFTASLPVYILVTIFIIALVRMIIQSFDIYK